MQTTPLITALVYTDSAAADRALRGVVCRLEATGMRLAGIVQRDDPRAGRARCDMVLEELSSGEAILISQDRGPHARGCRLVVGELLRAMQIVAAALDRSADFLILNKFGKTEAEGGGLRDLIVQAVERDVPVLVAVPYRNLDTWRAFAGDLTREIHSDALAPAELAAALAAIGDTDRHDLAGQAEDSAEPIAGATRPPECKPA